MIPCAWADSLSRATPGRGGTTRRPARPSLELDLGNSGLRIRVGGIPALRRANARGLDRGGRCVPRRGGRDRGSLGRTFPRAPPGRVLARPRPAPRRPRPGAPRRGPRPSVAPIWSEAEKDAEDVLDAAHGPGKNRAESPGESSERDGPDRFAQGRGLLREAAFGWSDPDVGGDASKCRGDRDDNDKPRGTPVELVLRDDKDGAAASLFAPPRRIEVGEPDLAPRDGVQRALLDLRFRDFASIPSARVASHAASSRSYSAEPRSSERSLA